MNKNFFVATAYPGTEMFRHPRVQAELARTFGLSFDRQGRPVFDQALHQYVLELDDATKVLHGPDGRPLNFGDMDEQTFLTCKQLVEKGRTYEILDL